MSKALALAAGFGEGYLGTKRQQKLDEERQEERELRLADARWQGEERERVRQDRARLADAVKPATVNDGAATLNMGDGAKVYDDAGVAGSDYRQARSMGLADVQTPMSTFAVNGKGFADRAAAEGAAAEYNAPKARDERITLAMAQTDPIKARQYEAQGQQIKASATSQKLNDMQVAERAWRQKVGEAMTGGFDSLADLVTQTEVGPLAGKKAKAVPSADGKSIVFNVIGDDGTLTPVPSLTFPNDQTGVRMAGYILDKTVTPQDRYTTWVNEEKSKAAQARDAARDAETVRHNKVVEANGTMTARAAAARAARGGDGEGSGRRERTEVRQLAGQTQTQLNSLMSQIKAKEKSLSSLGEWVTRPPEEKKAAQAELADLRAQHKAASTTLAELNEELQGARPRLSDARPLAPGATPAPTAAPAPGARPAAAPRAAAAPPPPAKGATMEGYRFNGGNPADPKNWTKL